MNRLRERLTRITMTDQGCMLRAYSREIVAAVAASREVSTYIPALAYTFASSPTEIEVAHEERAAGESKYSLYKLIRLNFDLVTGFSLVPLQLFSMFGMLVSALSLATYVIVIAYRLVFAEWHGVLHAAPAVGPRHPRLLPDRHAAVRPRPHRRIRRAHLPAGARASALHGAAVLEARRAGRPSGRRPTAPAMTRAVVFAYHNVGVRCLKVLLAHGVDVPLVVTHEDDPRENVWFDSVAAAAARLRHPGPRARRPERAGRRRAGRRCWRPISCSRSTTGRC